MPKNPKTSQAKQSDQGLKAPILDDQDKAYQEKLGALTDEDMDKLIEGLRSLKGKDAGISLAEFRDKTGL